MFKDNVLEKLKKYRASGSPSVPYAKLGKVLQIVGTIIEVSLGDIPLGARVRIAHPQQPVEGEVVGFKKDRAMVIPFCDPMGVNPGALVECVEREPYVRVGDFLLGRIIDSYGNPLEGEPFDAYEGMWWPLLSPPINPLKRRRIRKVFDTGVQAFNSFLTFGEGQRVGIMAGSGVGKSVLMGMVARFAEADVNVIALIGERGREVREFLEDNLKEEGCKKSVVVVSTSDQSPLSRVRAAHLGTSIAEYFRDQGKRVLLMMDSLTRVAMAQREIGLAAGEPPTTKGYTPSVFSLLPRILERAGNNESAGSLTGIYTVLVDGDDFQDPICDSARSILDGHINLSRRLAERNHFPAIDVLSSISRVMMDIVDIPHLKAASKLRDLMAEYQRNEDLLLVGAYHAGANPKLDEALALAPRIEHFLKQDRMVSSDFSQSVEKLMQLVKEASV